MAGIRRSRVKIEAKNAKAQMTAMDNRMSFAGRTALMSVKHGPVNVGYLRLLDINEYRSNQYATALRSTKVPAMTAS